jgi:HD-GYP domain-containing protein (c-di-GMP phosphodiesterase class II)
VLSSDKPLLVEDLPGSGTSPRRDVRSAVSVPISDEEGVVGVLNVGSRAFPARFTRAHMDAVEVLGRQACVAYRNAVAVDSVRDLYLSTLRTLAVAIESKDPYSRGSTDRVLDLCSALGRMMGMEGDELVSLEVAALFHDMGMAAVGGVVSTGDRPLSTVERGLLKMHPVIAADILEQAPALAAVAPIVYHHHEHYDGTGYANGVSGEDIPLGARVLSVVDAYVAMTSARPYRAALSVKEAASEIRDHAGTQFDPEVVDRFLEMLGRETARRAE